MGCNPTDQDQQTDPQHEEKVPSYHRGIWGNQHGIDKHVSLWLSIDLQNEKPGVALRFLALFTIDPHPVLRLIAGATIIRNYICYLNRKVNSHSFNRYIYGSRVTND